MENPNGAPRRIIAMVITVLRRLISVTAVWQLIGPGSTLPVYQYTFHIALAKCEGDVVYLEIAPTSKA